MNCLTDKDLVFNNGTTVQITNLNTLRDRTWLDDKVLEAAVGVLLVLAARDDNQPELIVVPSLSIQLLTQGSDFDDFVYCAQ